MLFNSYEFIFAFLPVTIIGFLILGMLSRTSALLWIIATSLFFYGWWRPFNVVLIAPSILINFGLARLLLRLGNNEKQPYKRLVVLLLGIAFNVVFLGYFKYIDFVRSTVNDVFGTNFVLMHIILPLGISFITFQKIAFLIDVHAKRVTAFTLLDYSLFVLFFPQLIAGPIVHYREMMPQFHAASCRFDKENFAVGFTLLFFGLFKKTVFADSIAPLVTPIYEQASAGNHISLVSAWMAAIGFTLQIYFDFSGYSDMALGLARMFGIRLPQNFDSPLQASSIIDFWLRWHMTLTRFLTAYLYNPLTLWLTRRRLIKGRSVLRTSDVSTSAFVTILMFPTLMTMFVSGLWHGAGYGFICWGVLHGFYLTVNHAWRLMGPLRSVDRLKYERFMKPVGLILTFISVSAAMVFFRSPTIASAMNLVKGMIGLNGVALPQVNLDQFGSLTTWFNGIDSASQSVGGNGFILMVIWISVLMFIVLACPNTLQILARFEPALGVKPPLLDLPGKLHIEWSPSLAWAIGVSVIAIIGIFSLSGPSEFLYWQF